MNLLGLRDQRAIDQNGTSPVYQPGEPAGNGEEAGYQPASPVEQIHPYREVRERDSSMHMLAQAPQASMATPTPTEQPDTAPALPRTFTITSKDTQEKLTFTCMPGCTINHQTIDASRPTTPDDVCCLGDNNGEVSLPFEGVTVPKESYVLRAYLRVAPFATTMAERLPHVMVEVVEDEYVQHLDPDSLAVVIGVLDERLDALRRTHAELVQVRAEVLGRTVQAAKTGSGAAA